MEITLFFLLLTACSGNVYDMTFPLYKSACPKGCASWTNAGNATYQPTINAMWKDGVIPDDAKFVLFLASCLTFHFL